MGFTTVFAVAAGGAFGAVARYLVYLSPVNFWFANFPLATFLINVLGSFALGFAAAVFSENSGANKDLHAAITIGFLGAFTTFSTFELEIFELIRTGAVTLSLVYIAGSVLCGLAAFALGVMLGKAVA